MEKNYDDSIIMRLESIESLLKKLDDDNTILYNTTPDIMRERFMKKKNVYALIEEAKDIAIHARDKQ